MENSMTRPCASSVYGYKFSLLENFIMCYVFIMHVPIPLYLYDIVALHVQIFMSFKCLEFLTKLNPLLINIYF